MIVLTGTNTYTGSTIIDGGTVEIGGSGSLGNGNYAVNITDDANLVFASSTNQTLSSHITGTGSLSEIGPGTLSLPGSGNTYTGGTTNTGGTLIVSYINESSQTSIGTGPLYVGGGTLSYTNTAAATTGRGVTNVVSGVSPTINVPNGSLTMYGPIGANPAASFTIIKTGAGTLIIGSPSSTNGNSYDGVTVQGGTVILNKPGTYNAVGGPVTVNSGGELELGGSSPTGGSAEFYTGSSTPLTINSGGIFDLHGQGTTIYSTSVAGSGNGNGAISNSAAGACTLNSPITLSNNTAFGCVGGIMLPAPIGGAYGLTNLGPGTLTLGATNTYTGGTTVRGGTLDVNTNGSIQGNVTVSAATTLELDNAAALAANATLTVASGSTNKLNYSGTNTIGALYVAGVAQPQGVYGATASNPGGVFTGTGTVKVVAAVTYPRPGITSFSHSGNTLTFSATNGSANGTYYILESTNEMLPIPQWNVIYTNAFNGSGDIVGQQVPVANSHDSREFYILLQSTNVSAFP
jgi:autotransporter-associated beta strand protein